MTAPGMGGRLVALPAAWLVGVALQLQERELLPDATYIAILGAALLALLGAVAWRRLFLIAIVGAAAAGFALTGWQAASRLADTLPANLEGQDVVFTGVVASLPQQGASGLRFRFALDAAGAPPGVPRLLALGWYAGVHEDAAVAQPRLTLRAGQRWRFTVRLRQPHGNLNPHGFDYELALLEQGIRATGYVRAPPATLLDASAGFPLERLR